MFNKTILSIETEKAKKTIMTQKTTEVRNRSIIRSTETKKIDSEYLQNMIYLEDLSTSKNIKF